MDASKSREFYNLAYDKCHIIAERNGFYLVYATNNFEHFIVCNYIDEMGAMLNQKFFKTSEEACEYFMTVTKEKNSRRR